MFSCFRSSKNVVAPEGRCCQQLRIRCDQLEMRLKDEEYDHMDTLLYYGRANTARESAMRDMEDRIFDLRQQNADLKRDLDEANKLLKQEQQNILDSACQLEATRRKLMRETALHVEGSSSRLASRLEDILLDPITCDLIEDPVIMPSGNTVGRQGLLGMQSHGLIFDPLTRGSLANNEPLHMNLLVARVVKAFKNFKASELTDDFESCTNALSSGSAVSFVRELDELLVDPESLGLVEGPVVLPSGNTVSAQRLRMNDRDRRIVYRNLLIERISDAYKEFLSSSGL